MAVNPNTNFTVGQVATADQMNRFPRGIIQYQSITSIFTTVAPHTTLQNNGATLTISEVSGRLYRVTYSGYPYPSGGQQSIAMRINRAGVVVKDINVFSGMSSPSFAPNVTNSVLYLATSSGSVTWTVSMAGATVNTSVSDFGNSSSIRQFWIEDLGPA